MASFRTFLGEGPGCGARSPTASCFSRKAEGKAPSTTELPPEYLTSPLSQQSQVPAQPAHASPLAHPPGPSSPSPVCPQLPPKRDETALQEEEELQLALALSQSEAEEKERMVSGEWAGPEASPRPGARGAPPGVWGGQCVPRAPCTTPSSRSFCRDRSLHMPRTPRPSLHPWPRRLPPPAACTPRPW